MDKTLDFMEEEAKRILPAFNCACGNSLKFQDDTAFDHDGEVEISFSCPTCGRRYYKTLSLVEFDLDESMVEDEDGLDGCEQAHAQIEESEL